jgi:hypothetical protein
MAEPVILSWTPANWITVLLMVGIGFFVVAAASKVIQQKANKG